MITLTHQTWRFLWLVYYSSSLFDWFLSALCALLRLVREPLALKIPNGNSALAELMMNVADGWLSPPSVFVFAVPHAGFLFPPQLRFVRREGLWLQRNCLVGEWRFSPRLRANAATRPITATRQAPAGRFSPREGWHGRGLAGLNHRPGRTA